MAKKDIQDDVLGNKFSLMNAKSSKLLSSWMGAEATIAPSSNDVSDSKIEDADLKQADFGHDRLGLGSAIPKDIADGSFTRRAPTSNDKLLEQLIGRKRAKAHIAAKQEAERASARQQPTWQQKKEEKKEEESEDEEQGRVEILSSKRRKANESNPKAKPAATEIGKQEAAETQIEKDLKADNKDTEPELQAPNDEQSDDDIDLKPKKRVKKNKTKPTSYLDELLAERSKKKKDRGKEAEGA